MTGLRWQLLGPIAALCTALLLVQSLRIYHDSLGHIEDHALVSARRIHDALSLTADSVAERDDLFRVWTAMAAEREIAALLLAHRPDRVVIASKRRWVGQQLRTLRTDLGPGEVLLQRAFENRREHFRIEAERFWFAAPFEFSNDNLQLPVPSEMGFLIAIDLSTLIRHERHAALLEVGSQIVISLVALLALWVLLSHRILNPLATLTRIARGENLSTAGMAPELVQVGSALQAHMARILEERARYDGVFEQATEGIVLLHADGRLERANPSAATLLNLPPEGGRFEVPIGAVIGRDGVERILDFNQFELQGIREPLTVVMIRDVTRQQKTERLLRNAANAAETAARLQAEFVSTISHELRTPLTSIRGTIDLLMKVASTGLPPTGRELIEIAQRNLQRLGTLINDLLDLGKLESGRLAVSLAPVDLATCLADCVETLIPYAERHGVKLEFALPACPAPGQIDPDRYAQIIANLVSNAVKFSPRGAVVTIRLQRVDDHWRTEVIDTGAGIPAAFVGRVFSKFSQADSGDGRSRSGTGLGLYISRSLAELMHGRLDYRSEAGVGSTFYLDLPASTP